ncbi:acetate--CoA ligase [Thermoplasmatales archaeon ex4572_165]|nr:MAG: acetate--CoA ligase [Thermoplasmatales archaeon ex4572_165]RLF60129.1 MAG: acetate--CoA ligase [Thermoplasmata archaeon]
MAEEVKTFKPNQEFSSKAYIKNMDEYKKMYEESIKDPSAFWGKLAEEQISWFDKWTKVQDYDFKEAKIKWFTDAKLNASYNCLDRHIEDGHGDDTAIIWEGNEPTEDKKYTYKELLDEVQKFSNVLKNKGIKKGDRVCIYLQMVPELAISMLACARIGAVHSIVFGGFSADSLRDRINDSECKMLITQDEGVRGAKPLPMKTTADKAVQETPSIESVVVVKRIGSDVEMTDKDYWWHDEMKNADAVCPPEHMDAEDPLFILYTSGSTGKPKGVLHTTGGYLVYSAVSHKYVFDYHPGDVYWCTADIGWITGHSYIIYGPLANKAVTIMYEGVPNYPDWGRFWAVCEKHNVNIFYTAPTALRALMREGDDWVKQHDRSSLRLLGTVGEPIKSKEWNWYFDLVGNKKCPIVDTWWQTETGGILITPMPGATPLKPGSATFPFFGVEPMIVDEEGNEIKGNDVSGNLVIKTAWPGMMRTLYGDHKRFKDTYFTMYPGNFYTGDGVHRDADGYYWITGRVDDVINVSGHRIGSAEVEGALGKHIKVAEAAVVGFPHEIKGQGIYAYVTLKTGESYDDTLTKELVQTVRTEIGPIASPDKIQFTQGLPKTRSGKIMRRILRKIADGNIDQLGDTSTLADPSIVDALVKERK